MGDDSNCSGGSPGRLFGSNAMRHVFDTEVNDGDEQEVGKAAFPRGRKALTFLLSTSRLLLRQRPEDGDGRQGQLQELARRSTPWGSS